MSNISNAVLGQELGFKHLIQYCTHLQYCPKYSISNPSLRQSFGLTPNNKNDIFAKSKALKNLSTRSRKYFSMSHINDF